ncbi:MAG: 2-dehydro-3-deoxygalactonokinase [Rhizobiaceae bacterium]
MADIAECADWVAVDWGTTHMRAWLMRADGTAIGRRRSDKGMGSLRREEFEPALVALLGDACGGRRLPAIVCGMAGARQGWAEAAYVAVPCAPPSISEATQVPADSLDVRILPGVKQNAPADVMRGEETQIAGLLAGEPGFEGVVCLPGTHSKWAAIADGRIVRFSTFMTGELFALISGQSVLRHSVASDVWDQAAFDEAVGETIEKPNAGMAKLFALRAEGLLHGLEPAAARARLSAYLIGAEIAAAREVYALEGRIAVVGAAGIAKAYGAALTSIGAEVRYLDAERTTLMGLTAAYAELCNS